MATALFLLANGFEELEFTAPYDILHRGGVNVKTVSITSRKEVSGAHELVVLADSLLQQVDGLPFDMLILPGGGEGTENLIKNDAVKNLIIKSYETGKRIAAICAAPSVLVNAGILGNHCVTSYPALRSKIEPHCKKYLDVPIVVSENIITSRGAGTAAEFGFCLLSLMMGFEITVNVRGKMMF